MTTQPRPAGPISSRWFDAGFNSGYQAALADLADRIGAGDYAVHEWLRANIGDEATAALLKGKRS